MELTLFGIVTLWRLPHDAKAYLPMTDRLFPSVKSVRLEQFSNAFSFSVVTVPEMNTRSTLVQFANAYPPMTVTPFGRETSVRLVQL